MAGPTAKSELLERIEAGWAELDRALARLSPDQLAAAGPGEWAIKDHLSHLAAWERSVVALLEGRDLEAGMGLEPSPELLDTDQANRRLFELHRGLDAAAARALLATTNEEVRRSLAGLDDSDLEAPFARYQPSRPDEEGSVLDWITGNTYEHVEEHLGWIAELIRDRGW